MDDNQHRKEHSTAGEGYASGSVNTPKRVVVALGAIDPDPFQPRKHFDPLQLQGLADSIRDVGLMQPPAVRPHPDPAERAKGRYMIICGERRWRAHGLLVLTEIRVELYENLSEIVVRKMQLAENAARNDLNIIEEAEGYQLALEALHQAQYPAPQQALAAAIGMNETTLSKKLKVLSYPEDVRGLIRDGIVTQVNALSALVKLKPEDREFFVTHSRNHHAEGQKVEVARFMKDPAKYMRSIRKETESPAPAAAAADTTKQKPLAVWSTRLIVGRPQFLMLVKATGYDAVSEADIQAADEGSLKEYFERFKAWVFPADQVASELGIAQ